jgi:hypothetical protein
VSVMIRGKLIIMSLCVFVDRGDWGVIVADHV